MVARGGVITAAVSTEKWPGDAKVHVSLVNWIQKPSITPSRFVLDDIEVSLPRRVRDKNQALLLHCQSGMRSGVAKKKLKALGYANAFNLGSYGRAAQIVDGA